MVKQYSEVREEMKQRDKKNMVFVTLYEVSREYGGPEEGGWWYNWLTPVKSIRCRRSQSEATQNRLYKSAREEYGADRWSGRLKGATIMEENVSGEYETKRRPYYE